MMSDAHDAPCTPEPISQELDDLTCSLIDYALDILATSGELSVSLAVADKAGKATLLTFDDDDFEESIEGPVCACARLPPASSKLRVLPALPCVMPLHTTAQSTKALKRDMFPPSSSNTARRAFRRAIPPTLPMTTPPMSKTLCAQMLHLPVWWSYSHRTRYSYRMYARYV